MTAAWQAEYDALTTSAGVAVLNRSRLELRGRDRAKFLQAFCTNDVLKLTPGAGCEAFFLNAKGKILGYAYLLCREDSLRLDMAAGQAEAIASHLDRYLIREDVQFVVPSDEAELLLAGPTAAEIVSRVGNVEPPASSLSHVAADFAGVAILLSRVPFGGNASFFLACAASQQTALRDQLTSAGAVTCGDAAVEAVRIESQTPLFGRDITDENLPQEVGRDAQAVNFKKGCYLGQETVARIDAMGHVNRLLVRLRFAGPDVPAQGLDLQVNGQSVGHVTSATYSPRFAAPLALGYVRRGLHAPGLRLTSSLGEVEVV